MAIKPLIPSNSCLEQYRNLQKQGLPADVIPLQAINIDCAKFYKAIQRHLNHTKTSLDDYRPIDLPELKRNTMPNSTQLRYLVYSLESILDEATSFYGFTPFIYMLREAEVHKDDAGLSSGITFSDRSKAVARLDGNTFYENNRRFYTSLIVAFASYGISYCDKNE